MYIMQLFGFEKWLLRNNWAANTQKSHSPLCLGGVKGCGFMCCVRAGAAVCRYSFSVAERTRDSVSGVICR